MKKRQNENNELQEKIQKVDEEEEFFNESSIMFPFPDPTDYKLIKRTPSYQIKKNDIYVKRNSNFVAQMKRVQLLFDQNIAKTVTIYGLGSQIEKAIDLSMKLKEIYGKNLKVGVNTDTVKLVDEFEPLKSNLKPFSQIRYNSSVKITLIYTI